MEIAIKDKLRAIAEEYQIEILFACESGSRAWGFPSTDSDYDVRFIYVRKSERYLSIFDTQEDLKFPISDDLDVYGWDLRKVLRLLYKSNVTPFEWIQSPILYSLNEDFVRSFKDLLPDFYSIRKHAHHYLGLVTGRMDQVACDEMGLKTFFYILRSLLSAKWGLTYQRYAPMELEPLMQLLPGELTTEVGKLITLKSTVDENYRWKIEKIFRLYFVEEYSLMCEQARCAPKDDPETDVLDLYFRDVLAFT